MNTDLIVLSHLCLRHPSYLLSLAYRIEVLFFHYMYLPPSFILFRKNTIICLYILKQRIVNFLCTPRFFPCLGADILSTPCSIHTLQAQPVFSPKVRDEVFTDAKQEVKLSRVYLESCPRA